MLMWQQWKNPRSLHTPQIRLEIRISIWRYTTLHANEQYFVDIVAIRSYGQIVCFVEVYAHICCDVDLAWLALVNNKTRTDDKTLPTKYQFPIDIHYGFWFVLLARCEGRTQFCTLAGKTIIWNVFDLQSMWCSDAKQSKKKTNRPVFLMRFTFKWPNKIAITIGSFWNMPFILFSWNIDLYITLTQLTLHASNAHQNMCCALIKHGMCRNSNSHRQTAYRP